MKSSLERRFGAAVVFSLSLTILQPSPGAAEDGAPKAVEGNPKAAVAADDGKPGAAAPAHGARVKTPDGTLVVYDKVIGIHRVPDREFVFWSGERFFRFEQGVWLASSTASGPWTLTPLVTVPVVLRERFGAPKKKVSASLPGGVEAVWDPSLRAYRIAGRSGVFLFDGRFYRFEKGVWFGADAVDGPWGLVSARPLPQVLRHGAGKPPVDAKVKLPGGEVVVFDAEAALFRVEGKEDAWFFDGALYEKRGSRWFTSTGGASPFEEVGPAKVPAPVRGVYRSDDPKKAASAKKPAGDGQAGGKPASAKAGGKPASAKAGGKPASAKTGGKPADAETGGKPAGARPGAAKSAGDKPAKKGPTKPEGRMDAPGSDAQ